MKHYGLILFILLLVVSTQASFAQQSVGIGTNNPNPKAVLQLVSPGQNQGFLLPKLTTAQVSTLGASLVADDKGLMVYDSLLQRIQYWDGAAWLMVSTGASAGTVTSVGLALPSIFIVSGSPVTASGTLTGTLANQAQNTVFAGPTIGTAPPTFRALVAGDIPALDAGIITTGTFPIARGGTNSTAIPTAGAIAFGTGTAYDFTSTGTSGQVLQSNGAGAPTWITLPPSGWSLTGNAGTNPLTNFIGTTDTNPLRFRVNNIPAGYLGATDYTFLGYQAGLNNTGSGNTGFGHRTLATVVTATENTAIGNNAEENLTTGIWNVAVGSGALRQLSTANYNTAVGTVALANVQGNWSNTAIGSEALQLTRGSGNSAIGRSSGQYDSLGDFNTYLGFGTGPDTALTLTNATAVGAFTRLKQSNTVILGNNSNVGIGTNLPSQRLDVVGSVKFSGALMPNNNAGTAGQVLTSAGPGLPPTWGAAVGSGWGLTGNAGTNPALNFIGTSDLQALNLRTNNQNRISISETGRVNILESGVFEDYSLRIQANQTAGLENGILINRNSFNNFSNASIAFKTFTSGGDSSSGFISIKNDQLLDRGLQFMTTTGGLPPNAILFNFRDPATTQVMSILRNGNTAIGNVTPTERLHVVGNVRFSGALMPNNSAGTAGQVLTSAGAGAAPTWENAGGSGWSLTGNSGTNPSANFIGTTDAQDFRVRTNNLDRLAVTSSGNVGIGTNSPSQRLELNGNMLFTGSTGLVSESATVLRTTTSDMVTGSDIRLRTLRFFGDNIPTTAVSQSINAPDGFSLALNTRDLIFSPPAGNDFTITSLPSVGFRTIFNLGNRSFAFRNSGSGQVGIESQVASTNPFYIKGAVAPTADYFQIQSNASSNGDVFSISSSGNVGIGATVPLSRLQLGSRMSFFTDPTSPQEIMTRNIYNDGTDFRYILAGGATAITMGDNRLGMFIFPAGLANGIAGSPIGRFNFTTTGLVINGDSPNDVLDVRGPVYINSYATAPGTTTDRLYNVSGDLFWNGTNISSGSSGANQTLSNLTNPTAINQDLRFDNSADRFIGFPAGFSPVQGRSLTLAGEATSGSFLAGGNAIVQGGFSASGVGGGATMSGGSSSTFAGGNVGINAGDGGAQGGSTFIRGGNSSGGTGGNIFMTPGDGFSTNGNLYLASEFGLGLVGRVGIGLNGTTQTPTALLDITANTSARAALRLRNGVPPTTPNQGDIYADGNSVFYRNATSWVDLGGSSSGWSLTGNAGTIATDFIGTTDLQDFRVRTNNLERMTFAANGNIGIGATVPRSRLQIGNRMGVIAGYLDDFSAITRNIYIDNADDPFYLLNGSANVLYMDDNFIELAIHPAGVANAAISIPTRNLVVGLNGIGLNTSNPIYPAHLVAGSIGYGFVHEGGGVRVGTYVNAAGGWLGTQSNHDLRLFTNDNAGDLIIQASTGNVGVGISTPSAKVHAFSTATASPNTALYGEASSTATQTFGVNGTANGSGGGQFTYGVYGQGSSASSENYGGFFFGVGGTNSYGVYGAASGATNNWAAYFDIGNVHITNSLSLGTAGNFGAAGQVLTSAGPGLPPTWSASGGSGWGLTGNAATNPATNFIGTTDNVSLNFRTNNISRFTIDSLGRVFIGLIPPSLVSTDFQLTNENFNGNIVSASYSNTPGFAGNYFTRRARGTLAAPLAIQASDRIGGYIFNGYDGVNFVGSALMYAVAGENWVPGSNGTALIFTTTSNGTTIGSERFRIHSNGNLGIANAAPTERLDVTGNVKFSGALMPNNLPGAAGQVLTSAGPGLPPTWSAGGGSGWGLTGNAGTNPATNFIGTTDAQEFRIRTNNVERVSVGQSGSFSIIGSSFNSDFNVGPNQDISIQSGSGNGRVSLNASAVGDVLLASGGGYVGVGTNNPLALLSVGTLGGSAASTTFATNAGALGTGGLNELALASIGFNSGNQSSLSIRAIRQSAGTDWTTTAILLGMDVDNTVRAGGAMLAISNNGNIGIGTGAPTENLTVQGGVNIDNGSLNNGTVANSLRFGFGASGEAIAGKRTPGGNQFGLDFYTAGIARMSVTNTGNVGIGTSTPTANLTVAPPSGDAEVLIESNANAALTIDGATGNYAAVDFAINGTLEYGVGVFNGDFYIDETGVDRRITVEAGTGNVGVGTIAPLSRLHVESAIPAANEYVIRAINTFTGSADGVAVYGQSTSGPANWGIGVVGRGNYIGVEALAGAGALAAFRAQGFGADAGHFVGNVQISTGYLEMLPIAAPGLVTNRLYNDGGNLYWNGTNISSGSSGWGLTGNTLSGTERLGSDNAQPLVFETNNSEAMRIDAFGNLGIGTNAPTVALSVAGPVAVDFAGANIGDIDNSLVFGQGFSGEGIGSKRNAGTGQFGLDFYTASANRMHISNTGSVGIGTSTPIERLHVNGNAFFQNDIRFAQELNHLIKLADRTGASETGNALSIIGSNGGSGGFGVSGGSVTIQGGDAYNIGGTGSGGNVFITGGGNYGSTDNPGSIVMSTRIGTTTNERMRILGSGNVGIGTSTPGALLDMASAANGMRINLWYSAGASIGGAAYVGTNIYRNFSDNVWKYTNTHPNIGGAAIQFNGVGGAGTENDILFVRTNTPGTANANATVLESMRIKGGTGDVGIGTDNPNGFSGRMLHLSGTGNTAYILEKTDGTARKWAMVTGGGGEYIIQDMTGSVNAFAIAPGGNVGIGTTSPGVTLDINSSTTAIFLSGGSTSFNSFNGGTLSTGNPTPQVAVRANGAFLSVGSSTNGGFYVTSDERIKRKVGLTDSKTDLETLMQINITDYKYIDSLSSNNAVVKGVFAQQVEEIYPQAVSKQTNFIPNIYALAIELAYDESKQTLKVTMNKPHELVVGDKVKLISKSSGDKPCTITAVAGNSFTVSEWTEQSEKVFVYGKEVQDFRIVDYDRLFTLNLSATQEIVNMLHQQNMQVQSLKASEAEHLKRIEKLEAKLDETAISVKEAVKLKEEILKIKAALGLDSELSSTQATKHEK